MSILRHVNLSTFFDKLAGFLFQADLQRLFLGDFLFSRDFLRGQHVAQRGYRG